MADLDKTDFQLQCMELHMKIGPIIANYFDRVSSSVCLAILCDLARAQEDPLASIQEMIEHLEGVQMREKGRKNDR